MNFNIFCYIAFDNQLFTKNQVFVKLYKSKLNFTKKFYNRGNYIGIGIDFFLQFKNFSP